MPRDVDGASVAVFIRSRSGALVPTTLDSGDGICGMLTESSGCHLVPLDNQLAPEVRFAAAAEGARLGTRRTTAQNLQRRNAQARVLVRAVSDSLCSRGDRMMPRVCASLLSGSGHAGPWSDPQSGASNNPNGSLVSPLDARTVHGFQPTPSILRNTTCFVTAAPEHANRFEMEGYATAAAPIAAWSIASTVSGQ